jgi:ferredoxin-NADP reductase
VPVLSHEPYYDGERGAVTEAALRLDRWQNWEVYVCGPDNMVGDAVTRLVATGVPVNRIHTEDFDTDRYRTPVRATANAMIEVPTV